MAKKNRDDVQTLLDGFDEVPLDEKLKEYDRIIESVFFKFHDADPTGVVLPFTLKDVISAATGLNLELGNPPDVTYTYRVGRSALPQSIFAHGYWAIEGVSKGKYNFLKLNRSPYVDIPKDIKVTRILDSTPQIVLKYQGKDEQGILARIGYNRLVDIFTSLTAYHLQGHFRTTIKTGQVEVDDLYIGVDTDGNGFVIPIEAKSESPRDQLGVIQITQMVKLAHKQFPGMKVRPIGIKPFDGSFIFLEFNDTEDVELVATDRYKRYELYREK